MTLSTWDDVADWYRRFGFLAVAANMDDIQDERSLLEIIRDLQTYEGKRVGKIERS